MGKKPSVSEHASSGRVYLIGAGPGDPGLITLRAVELLRRCDAVLFDSLANPQLLEFAPPTAERICVGKHGETRIWTQQEINDRLVALAREGKQIVRLKGGDPSIFARIAEELDALAAASIPIEIVPGVTTALAAAAYAGAPLTHRATSSAVALVTGRESDDKETSIDFASLAGFPGTLVVYMGVTTVRRWSAELMQAGKSPETPVTIVRHCSLPEQSTLHSRLGDVAADVETHGLRPPVVFLIGETPRFPASEWFEQRPLFGQRVLLARSAEQVGDWARALSELGADVLCEPAIRIEPLAGDAAGPLEDAIASLHEYDWIVFSSQNGVNGFMSAMKRAGRDGRALAANRIAVVGNATRRVLESYFLQADGAPLRADQDGLLALLSSEAADSSFLLVRGSRGRDTLREGLEALGGRVRQVAAYESADVTELTDAAASRIAQRPPDWIVVASSATARAAVSLFRPLAPNSRWCAISSVTQDALEEAGIANGVAADEPSIEGVVAAIRKAGEADGTLR